jgi:hypothetical protein
MKLFFLCLLLVSCVTTPKQEIYKFTKQDVEAVQKLKEILPFRLEQGVFLVNVELLEGGTIKNTVLIKDQRIIRYFRKAGIQDIISKQFVCSDPEMKDFLNKGGTLTYQVITSKENFGSVSLTKEQCSKRKSK